MATNKIKVEIEMTAAQKKDFLRAIFHIVGQGASDEGRACQLLAANYFSGIMEDAIDKDTGCAKLEVETCDN